MITIDEEWRNEKSDNFQDVCLIQSNMSPCDNHENQICDASKGCNDNESLDINPIGVVR